MQITPQLLLQYKLQVTQQQLSPNANSEIPYFTLDISDSRGRDIIERTVPKFPWPQAH